MNVDRIFLEISEVIIFSFSCVQVILLLIYFRYRPSTREPQSGSAHAVMDISLVSGLEANREDLSTVSIEEHLPSAGDFSDNCDTYCSSSLSVKLVVQILL